MNLGANNSKVSWYIVIYSNFLLIDVPLPEIIFEKIFSKNGVISLLLNYLGYKEKICPFFILQKRIRMQFYFFLPFCFVKRGQIPLLIQRKILLYIIFFFMHFYNRINMERRREIIYFIMRVYICACIWVYILICMCNLFEQ